MAERQTRNVSLSPQQDAFVDELVETGRFRTFSEAMREGLRLLEEAEHRRLLEKWIYKGLNADEEKRLPEQVRERATTQFRGFVEAARADIENGRVSDGPAAMKRLRKALQAKRR
jgi:antitoxin ParD1/3/4